jgi:hypothetical protein
MWTNLKLKSFSFIGKSDIKKTKVISKIELIVNYALLEMNKKIIHYAETKNYQSTP